MNARWLFVGCIISASACTFIRDVDDLDRGSSAGSDAAVEDAAVEDHAEDVVHGDVASDAVENKPITLAKDRASPLGIALDAEYVYWTEQTGSLVARMKKDGTGTLLESVICCTSPQGIAVDAQFIYVADSPEGQLVRLALDGTNPVKMLSDGQGYPRRLVIDGSDLFWTNFNAGEVRRAPNIPGQSSVLVSSSVHPFGLAVDASNVYWADAQPNGAVYYADKNGGSAQTIASGLKEPHDVALSDGYVYWAENGGSIKRWKVGTTSDAIEVLYTGSIGPDAIAADAGAVFWTNVTDGTVLELPPGAPEPIVLATGGVDLGDIAIDAQAVYFTDRGATSGANGTVTKVPR